MQKVPIHKDLFHYQQKRRTEINSDYLLPRVCHKMIQFVLLPCFFVLKKDTKIT